MRLGIWTPLPHTVPPEPRLEAVARQSRIAGSGTNSADSAYRFAKDIVLLGEANGFDITLIAARHFGPDLDAWTLASALGAVTRSMELMVAVHPGINTPQMVAKMAASLDRITDGRAAVNVVNGWNRDEFNIFGNGAWLDGAEQRYRRMDEFVQVMRGLWEQEPFSFAGDFYQVDAGALPLRPAARTPPPIYAASRSEIGKAIIARHCDHWFVPDLSDFRRYDDTMAFKRREIAAMTERAAAHGRTVGYGLSAHVICMANQAEAEAKAVALEAHGRMARYFQSASKALGACLIGPPALIAERIAAYEEIGIDLLMLHFTPMQQGLQQFIDEVLPRLRTRPPPLLRHQRAPDPAREIAGDTYLLPARD